MFGYIRVFKPELRIKEWEMYRAVYCTLCKKLGKNYGLFARMTLSYDFTFLALLKMSLSDDDCQTKSGRCAFNPAKKCNYVCSDKTEEDFDFFSATAMIMLYYKLLDNICDEKGISKIKYFLFKPLFKNAYKKAALKYPSVDEIFKEYIKCQKEVETINCRNIDQAAEPTAVMLSKVFCMCAKSEADKRALSRLGYCLGKYIYILDAATDLEKDIKKGRYNPFLNTSDVSEIAKRQLYFCINEAAMAFELIEIHRFKNILANIIYLGTEDTLKKELKI